MFLAIASLMLSAYAQKRASDNNNEIADQNYTSAIEAQTIDNRQLNEQTRQQEEQDADQNLEARIQALRAQSALQAQGRNVSGTSVDRQRNAVTNSLGKYMQDAEANRESARRQLDVSKKGTSAQTQSRINSTPKTSYNPTLDIISTGLTIKGDYNNAKKDAAKADLKTPTFSDYIMGEWK